MRVAAPNQQILYRTLIISAKDFKGRAAQLVFVPLDDKFKHRVSPWHREGHSHLQVLGNWAKFVKFFQFALY